VHTLDALAVLLRDAADDLRAVAELRLERAVGDAGGLVAGLQHLPGQAGAHEPVFDVLGHRVEVDHLGRGDEHVVAWVAEREREAAHLDTDRLADRASALVDLLLRVVAVPRVLVVVATEQVVRLVRVLPEELRDVDT
jgi:hypothetical protein